MKGVIIMSAAILSLAISGILVKFSYQYNPAVTIYEMVFVRAFSQLIMSAVLAQVDGADLRDIPPN